MVNSRFSICLFFFLLTICSCQMKIQLQTQYNVTLPEHSTKMYTLTLQESIPQGSQLYISTYSTIHDPTQEPLMKVTYNGITKSCDSETQELNDICIISPQDISEGTQIKITLTCLDSCQATLYSYVSSILKMKLGESKKINNGNQPNQKLIRISIPQNQTFLAIQILYEKATGAVDLFVNFGENPEIPTKENHEFVQEINFGRSQGLRIAKSQKLKAGNDIIILMSIEANTAFNFVTRKIESTGITTIGLNSPVYDYLPEQGYKVYKISLPISQIKDNYSMSIYFDIYSGSPTIDISYDDSFSKSQIQSYMSGSVFVYQMDLASNEDYQGFIFIKMKDKASNYKIFPKYQKKANFETIASDETKYLQIKDGYKAVTFRGIFAKKDKVEYVANVEKIKGVKVDLSLNLCLNPGDGICFITDKTQLNNDDNFEEIAYNPRGNLIRFSIASNKCRQVQNGLFIECNVIFLFQTKGNKQSQIFLTINQKESPMALRQGQNNFGTLQKDSYHFYQFYLPHDTSNVLEVIFFLNRLTGHPMMISSLSIPSPTIDMLNQQNTDINYDETQIVYRDGIKLKSGPYHIAVYSDEYAEYSLTVLVHRKANGTNNGSSSDEQQDVTDIILVNGVTLQFAIPLGKTKSQFLFFPSNDGDLQIRLIQLIGKVSVKIQYENNKTSPQCSNTKMCTFGSRQGQPIKITVTGFSLAQQQFTILLVQDNKCYQFPIGTPLYATIEPGQPDCLEIRINKNAPIQLSTSLTAWQMLQQELKINITIAGEDNQTQLIEMLTNSLVINLQQDAICSTGECKLLIQFASTTKTINFQLIVQYLDGIIDLYDGVTQKMNTFMEKDKPKYFRYFLFSAFSMEIFLTTEDNAKFTVVAKLVPQKEYKSSNSTDIFPRKNETGEQVWTSSSTMDSKATSMITVPYRKLNDLIVNKKIKSAYILIAVYLNEDTPKQCSFTLEVTQSQRIIYDGQTLTGFLEANQIVTFEVIAATDSFLEVRPLTKMITGDDNCLKMFNSERGQLPLQMKVNSTGKGDFLIYLRAVDSEECAYQISLQQYTDSVLQISEGFMHRIKLEYNQKTHFLYYHNRDVSFKILEFMESGDSELYVTPITAQNINKGQGLQGFINILKPQDYFYHGKQSKYLQIYSTTQKTQEQSVPYCYNCYYLITVQASPFVHEQIYVAPFDSDITLKENIVVDDHLEEGQEDRFLYYSPKNIDFFYTIDVVYGNVEVVVQQYRLNPEGNVLIRKTLSAGYQLINIPANQTSHASQSKQQFDMFNPLSKYSLTIKANQNSLYHLQVSRINSSLRIVEGVPTSFKFLRGTTVKLDFSNLQTTYDINLLFSYDYNNLFVFDVKLITQDGTKKTVNAAIKKSGKMQSLQFSPQKGNYIVSITALSGFMGQVIVLLPRHDLTELMPAQSFIFQHQAIFQIYIPSNSSAIIQVFDCTSNVFLRGSQEYDQLTKATPGPNQIELVHENIGGHFVIHTKDLVGIGIFYIRVQNKQYSVNIKQKVRGVQYLIRYRLIQTSAFCPYQYLDISDDTVYSTALSKHSNVTFTFNAIKQIDPQKVKIKLIEYDFAIAEEKQEVQDRIVCMNTDAQVLIADSRVTNGFQENDDVVKINITKGQIYKQIGKKKSYVGIVAKVTAISGEHEFEDITYIYKPTYLNQFSVNQVIAKQSIILWIVLAVLIVGGIILAYTLIVNFIKISRGYQQDMVELNQEGSTTMQNPSHHSKKEGTVQN